MSYKEGLVSVIIPVCNSESYIAETLSSVFAQTYGDMELVLVDDRSSDRTGEIVRSYMAGHPELVYFLQPENLGAGAARNKALELAKGQYVAFLDSDDAWLPEKTERQLRLLKASGRAFSYTAIQMIDEDGHVIKPKRPVREQVDYAFLLKNTIIATSSVIIDREVLGDFRMPVRRGGQDYATWLMLLRGGTQAVGIDEALVQYRVHSGSLSSNKLKSIRQVWEIQTRDEGIGRLPAAWNTLCFCKNALLKYLL